MKGEKVEGEKELDSKKKAENKGSVMKRRDKID